MILLYKATLTYLNLGCQIELAKKVSIVAEIKQINKVMNKLRILQW